MVEAFLPFDQFRVFGVARQASFGCCGAATSADNRDRRALRPLVISMT
jgi:hypothetical protein